MTKIKRGFEVYWFDGTGGPPSGPLDFEEFMRILGEMDGDNPVVAGSDAELYTDETQGSLFDWQPEEPEGAGTRQETADGIRD